MTDFTTSLIVPDIVVLVQNVYYVPVVKVPQARVRVNRTCDELRKEELGLGYAFS